jgi:hypothetical protein
MAIITQSMNGSDVHYNLVTAVKDSITQLNLIRISRLTVDVDLSLAVTALVLESKV